MATSWIMPENCNGTSTVVVSECHRLRATVNRLGHAVLGVLGIVSILAGCTSADTGANSILSPREVAVRALDALAAQSSWKERWTATGIERSVGADGTVKQVNHTFVVTSTLQAPSMVDSSTSNMTGPGTKSRQIRIGTKTYRQEEAGTGPWRESDLGPAGFKDASERVGPLLRLFVDWTKLALTADVACGQARCYRLLVDGAPLDQGGAVSSHLKVEIVVDKASYLVFRQTMTLTYDSGDLGYADDYEFYDYGQPNDIRPPL
jgi:hypothetical protein